MMSFHPYTGEMNEAAKYPIHMAYELPGRKCLQRESLEPKLSVEVSSAQEECGKFCHFLRIFNAFKKYSF